MAIFEFIKVDAKLFSDAFILFDLMIFPSIFDDILNLVADYQLVYKKIIFIIFLDSMVFFPYKLLLYMIKMNIHLNKNKKHSFSLHKSEDV